MSNFKWTVVFRSEFLGRVVKVEMSSFQPYFIFNFPWSESLGGVLGHDLSGRIMCCKGFFSGFFQGRERVFQGWKECFSEWRVGTGFKFHHEREGGDFCGAVRNGVVVEFGCGKEF